MGEIFMFAQDAETNETVGIELGSTRGVVAYVPSLRHAQEIADRSSRGFQTLALPDPSAASVLPGVMDIVIVLDRGNMLRAFVCHCCVRGELITNDKTGIITIILLLVMFASVFFRFRQKGEILLLPVATLFAFTQLRASMPGAPDGFGDILGECDLCRDCSV
jgi:hypothetical protein